MSRKTDVTATGQSGAIDRFLEDAKRVAVSDAAARLIFALDATMSRQPTWDLATHLQAAMFDAVGEVGGLTIQLVYFRGFGECRASRWVADGRALRDLMCRIRCQGGKTQIGRVLRHVRSAAESGPLRVMVFVGDAMEESIDELCAVAGELGILGVKAFMFQEGPDRRAELAFREIARITGGAYERFDHKAPERLVGLLRAAATYASQGTDGLIRLAAREPEARALLTSLRGASS
ncbi:hypothetical protein [Microvirga massiliensis]|uniref:hypothetical protein n=1 Tax=Microvirga massiliensis TaxID=1033741 RepID=UPI00062BC0A8|nr:hypothetical protein [Microvirga massiliensis]